MTLPGYVSPQPVVLTSEQIRSMANARQQNASAGLVEPPRELNTPQPAATVSVPLLACVDRTRLREAALRATRCYPGVVGQILSRELLTWESFAFQYGGGGTIAALVEHVMTFPLPEPEIAAAAA